MVTRGPVPAVCLRSRAGDGVVLSHGRLSEAPTRDRIRAPEHSPALRYGYTGRIATPQGGTRADLRVQLPELLAAVRGNPARLGGARMPHLRRPQAGEEALRFRGRGREPRGRPGAARGVRVVRRSAWSRGVQHELTP